MMKSLIFAIGFLFSSLSIAQYVRPFEMEWEPVEEASQYEIEILSKDQKRSLIKKVTQKSSWSGEIRPGHYLYRLRTYDLRKVPGLWSDLDSITVHLPQSKNLNPKNEGVIQAQDDSQVRVSFAWSEVPMATSYQLKVIQLENQKSEIFESSKPSFEVSLNPGSTYEWSVLPVNPSLNLTGSESEIESFKFVIMGRKISKASIQKPESKYVREIKWDQDLLAKEFEVKFLRKLSDAKWETVAQSKVTESKADVPLDWIGGTYQIQVVSQSPLYKNSDISAINFELQQGDRSERAQNIAEMRDSIEGFTGWYGQASYLITQINYLSRMQDIGVAATTNFSTISGTGRLGFGYLGAKKQWGSLTTLDLSGMINQSGRNVTFASLESSALYRTQLSDRDELRFKFGGFYKELPFAIIDFSLGRVSEYKNIGLIGAMTGIEYWFSVTSKLGIQVHGYLNYGFAGNNPVSSSALTSLSQQYGLLGSLRLSKKQTGLIGLAYRSDSASFMGRSNGADTGTNRIEMNGIFLNLLLERGF